MPSETIDGVEVTVDSGAFILSEWDLLDEAQDVVLGVEKLCERGFAGAIEVASCAGHAMRALLEELVGAQAMAEVVVAPRLAVGDGLLQGVRVDQHVDGAQVAFEVAGVGVDRGRINDFPSIQPKGGAGCLKRARPDLCGGSGVTRFPTATILAKGLKW